MEKILNWWKKPQPAAAINSYWIDSMLADMKAADNKRRRLYRDGIQKRGRQARRSKPRRVEG